MATKENEGSLAEQKLALNEALLRQRVKGLRDANPRTRRKSARGLSSFGKLAERAIPLLETLLDDSDRRIRAAAAETLRTIRLNP
jgi:HEAT repeat protein